MPVEIRGEDGAQDGQDFGQAVLVHVVELGSEVGDLGVCQVSQGVRAVALCSYRHHCNSR